MRKMILSQKVRIRDRLIFIITIFSVVMITVNGVLFYRLYLGFEASIREQSSRLMSMTILGIDEKLKKLEDLTYEVFVDGEVQGSLPLPQRGAERDSAVASLSAQLFLLTGGEPYIRALKYMYPGDEGFVIGRQTAFESVDEGFLDEIYQAAVARQGYFVWKSGPEGNVVYLARMIRHISDYSFRELGVFLYSVDISRIVRDIVRARSDPESFLSVITPGGTVYRDANMPGEITPYETLPGEGAQIMTVEGTRYYTTYGRSEHTNWKYVEMTPYSALAGRSQSFAPVMIGALLMLMLSIFCAIHIARSITQPLEHLSRKMASAFADDRSVMPSGKRNEVQILEDSFQDMLNRIEHLIKEGYIRQLALKESQYDMLQSQINPHFLYNTLNAVDWMAKEVGSEDISRTVEALARLLRETINSSSKIIPLWEELDMLRCYLSIQQIRLREQFSFRMDVDERAYDCVVPKFTLQPLVENSIIHGCDPETGDVSIRIGITCQEGRLRICVEDDGPGFSQEVLGQISQGVYRSPAHHGVGLRNINERLNLFYDGDYTLKIDGTDGRMNRVVIQIPCRYGESKDASGGAPGIRAATRPMSNGGKI